MADSPYIFQYGGATGSLLYSLQFDEATKNAFAVAKAKSSGKTWEKVLDYVFTYGDRALSILSKNGIIPNKNIQAILQSNYDQNALNEFLAANGGSLTGTPENLKERSANNQILGIDSSTLVLIAAAVVLVMIVKK